MHPRSGWQDTVSTFESQLPSAARPGTGWARPQVPLVSVTRNAWLLLRVCSSPLGLVNQYPPAAQFPAAEHDTEVTQVTASAGRPRIARMALQVPCAWAAANGTATTGAPSELFADVPYAPNAAHWPGAAHVRAVIPVVSAG